MGISLHIEAASVLDLHNQLRLILAGQGVGACAVLPAMGSGALAAGPQPPLALPNTPLLPPRLDAPAHDIHRYDGPPVRRPAR